MSKHTIAETDSPMYYFDIMDIARAALVLARGDDDDV